MDNNTGHQTLDSMGQPKKAIRDVIDVVRHGDKIVIPEGLNLERVDAVIHARINTRTKSSSRSQRSMRPSSSKWRTP